MEKKGRSGSGMEIKIKRLERFRLRVREWDLGSNDERRRS